MDRALKERVIGAIVLVVFIVLVVPVFLDGPASDVEVISETVTLPGQAGQERKRQTIVLERDRSEPVPVAADSAAVAESRSPVVKTPPAVEAAQQDETPQPAPDTVAEETGTAQRAAESSPPAAAEPVPEKLTPAADSRSSTGMWAVQLGSFSNKANAERLAGSLRSQGYAAFISQLSGTGKQLHRVRIGPQKDRESAEAVATRLAAEGHKGQVVPHP